MTTLYKIQWNDGDGWVDCRSDINGLIIFDDMADAKRWMNRWNEFSRNKYRVVELKVVPTDEQEAALQELVDIGQAMGDYDVK